MTSRWITSLISTVALFGVTVSSAVPASAEQAQGKGPGVTRVSIVQGQVVVQRGDSNKQVAAVVNAPLLPGDYISTGERSRGELQFDGSTALRLGGNVQARITNDDPNNRQLQLADGTVEIGLVRGAGPVQVDTPSVTVRAHDAGDYRVSIGKDGSSWVTARRGSVEVVSPQRTYTLDSGRTLVARGSASEPSITYTTEVGYDSFDDFNAKRDETMVAALNASPNLNPDIAGYDNLGAYGQWQDVPGYGQSWIPNQSSNWSPYGNGSWTWEDGYGWTWVANEPWGWAPYHYGNWYYANNYGWAWAPPAYSAYPSWSPALVGFFGFGVGFGGTGWGVSLGFGSGGYPGYAGYGYGGFGYPYLGWYPIPPAVAFYPWWPGWAWSGYGWGWGGWGGSGWGNVANVTNITVINRYFPHGGIHGVHVGDFQHGTIHGHTVTVTPRMVGNRIGMIHGAVPVSPTRDNLGFGGHTISAPVSMSHTFQSPRFAAAGRSFAGHMAFDEQQRAVSRAIQSNGRNVAPVSASNDRVTNDRSGTLQRNALDRGNLNTGRETAGSGSWQRFGQERGGDLRGNDNRGAVTPGYANGTPRVERPNSDSWGRFSQARGNVPVTYGDRENASRNVMYGNPNRNDSQNAYRNDSQQRNPYESNTRNSYPSYSRESSYPSYSRGESAPSYSRGESAPSYSRNSYPSYSRGSYSSYPSYSRGSYSSPPSYSRGSQPSYPRGGSYSAPHPSGGSYSAPRQSGGGGGGNGGTGGNGGDSWNTNFSDGGYGGTPFPA
ncbi:MAG TPA: DUF6600 domain-containing protein, partial [Candidatus Cybelea sp.]